jgi:hypothetical protein
MQRRSSSSNECFEPTRLKQQDKNTKKVCMAENANYPGGSSSRVNRAGDHVREGNRRFMAGVVVVAHRNARR